MAKKLSLLIVLLVFLCSPIMAQDKSFGLGIILGEPTGISLKLWTGENSAIDGAAAWSFREKGFFHIHFDYLFHNFSMFNVKKGRLPFYYGIGGRIRFENETKFGIRIPLGIAYIFEEAPFDIFLEIVPLLNLVPDTKFDINASIGFRYYF